MSDLSTAAQVMTKLEQIEHDLSVRQGALEAAARAWFIAKRDKERARAVAFLSAEGTVAERSAIADRDTATQGAQQEAEYEALRSVVRTLEARATIGQTLARTFGRGA